MKPPESLAPTLSDRQLLGRQEEIRRGLARSNTATAVALLITISLALVAVFFAFQAEDHAQSAQRANRQTREELWKAQLARARALRLSDQVGRRQESLSAITNAVSIRPSGELRDEAIATLALMDIQPGPLWRPASPRVNAYGMSPRLNFYALGDLGGRVEVLAASNGQAVLEFARERQTVVSVHFSPDERFVAARWDVGTVEVWDVSARRQVFAAVYPQREPGTASLGFHPESRLLAVACEDETVRVINLESNRVEAAWKTEARPWTVAFDPAGSRLAVGAGRKVELFAHPSGQKVAALSTPEGLGRIAWHPFGHLLAGAAPSGRVTLLDVGTGRFNVLEAHTRRVIYVGFHPGGRLLATASWDGRTRFWDAGSGRPLLQTQAGFALEFDPSGERIGFFREGMGLGNWEVKMDSVYGTVALPLGNQREVLAVALSQDGRWLAGTTRDSIHLWEGLTGRELDSRPWPRSWGVAFTTDDRALVLSSDTGLLRLPLRTEAAARSPRFGEPEPISGAPPGPFSHGSITYGQRRWFGAEGFSKHAFVDLAPPHTVLTLPGRWDNSAPSTANGRLAATSRWKGHGSRVWDLETRQEVKALDDEGGGSLFSPDGRWLVVGTSTEFLFYETHTWQLARKLARDSASAISGLMAFSPDGRVLAVTHTLRQVRLLDPETGATLANLNAPASEHLTALAFSGNGSVLAAATDHSEVQVWNIGDLRQRLQAMRLDWPGAALAEAAPGAAPPAAVPSSRHRAAISIAGAGALLACLFAFTSIRQHRRLVVAYVAAEEIARQRRRELESTQAQLLHSEKMKALGTLAAGIAHDFNNLLSVIRMSGQLVKRQLQPTGLARENLDAIEQAVVQGKSIVESVLGYSRSPGDPSQPYAVNLVVSETLALLNQHYLSGIVLTLELDDQAPALRGDRSRLEQVLLNLIVNAAEAMHSRGKLTLQVRTLVTAPECVLPPRPAPCFVELTVRDSGPGIAPEHQARIFEPFFTTKTGAGQHGTGLGLTTVYTIAQQEGWGLAVESAPGQGATFRVVLPVEKPPKTG